MKTKIAILIVLLLSVSVLFSACVEEEYHGDTSMITDKDGMTYTPTSSNLQIALDKGGTVWLPGDGIIDFVSYVYIREEGTILRGSGNGSVLNLDPGRLVVRCSYVDFYDFKMIGSQGIYITPEAPGIDLGHYNICCVEANIKTGSLAGAVMIYPNDGEITDVTVRNYNAINCGGFGLLFGGWGSYKKVTNVLIEDCKFINCGRWEGRYISGAESWVTGLDICEQCDIEDVVVRRCFFSGNWESGFHAESAPTKVNVLVEDCLSVNNGQKPSATYGRGYLISGGMTLKNCKSRNNTMGFYVANHKGVARIINCEDDGSIVGYRTGGDVTGGKTYINGLTLKNSESMAFDIRCNGGIKTRNLVIRNPGENAYGFSVYLGRDINCPLYDCDFEIDIEGDATNALVVCNGQSNVTLRGRAKTSSPIAVLVVGKAVTITDFDLEASGVDAIHTKLLTGDTDIRRTIISGEPSYGVYNEDSVWQPSVDVSTVTTNAIVEYFVDCNLYESGEEYDTPGFEFVILFFAVSCIFLLIKKRKQND